MSSASSQSPWLYKAAAVTAAATLAAGAGYVIYKYVVAEPEAEPEPEMPVSMQELLTGGATGASTSRSTGPALPIRKTPPASKVRGAGPSLPARKPTTPSADATASTSDAAAAKPASANLKACGCCSQPLKAGGLPQRCGQCKSVYYCSVACQKKHWPEHKTACSKSGGTGSGSSGGDGASTAAAAEPTEADVKAASVAEADAAPAAADGAASSAADAKEAASSADGAAADADAAAGGAASGGHQGGLQGALVEVLRQAAEKGAGTLDGAFEEAVMFFLGGKLSTALDAFKSLQAAAREQGRSDLVQELHKWLGHTNTKLGNFAPAADAFRAGIEDAKKSGNAAARVDNAIGLGNLWKMAGKLTEAAEVLKEALLVAQEADSAGMQSEVLVALGNTVMAAEPEEGLTCLQIAVKLREDEVAKAAESGDRAGMATGMMQAAAAMVNMAAALFATRRFDQAKQAYEQAMEIFELMEDHDKVVQVLINLANLAELQLDSPKEALEYRTKLAATLKGLGHPGIAAGAASTPCGICQAPLAITAARAKGAEPFVILGCLHVQHDACFKKHCDESAESAAAVAAAAAAAARGGEVAAAIASAAASPGAKRTTTCPTCKAPVPVMT
ncbi:hypothetical protein HYH03_018763 [Edaphochlamys debaryana]|uniref:MYND-type domain-containing protein n=1 Tax=Edaphochlamys debaryana TaxID=47281 RepID=A0A835XL84_9CHLO|nr:hypothetical protein HYH03_018763 [Edaphochlamys debaryana]|eukprot:KAG2482299.1 hypothetical protein HYH03_018763 [Edaphochlamys debaryana]